MKTLESSFRKISDPIIVDHDAAKYVFYVKIENIALGIPMATNPRDQKLTSNVASAINKSLESNDGYFHLKNRGIVLSAEKVHYNNKDHIVTIDFSDDAKHGNIDGGHTYKIVKEHINDGLNQYVQFEVMTGVEGIIDELAEARNTSVQVDEKSMAELQGKFDPIKKGIEALPFYKRIAFKQNQVTSEDGKKLKMIDARDVVATIIMFNPIRFSEDNHPVQAYSSKAKMLDYYLEDPEEYRKFIAVMPDIFNLYDLVETEFADVYNSTSGRYGRKKYSGYKEGKTYKSKYELKEMQYKIPDGFLYPIVAAFRTLLTFNETSQQYEWTSDPTIIWNTAKKNIITSVMNQANSIGDNPNTVGKQVNTWNMIYMTVQINATGINTGS